MKQDATESETVVPETASAKPPVSSAPALPNGGSLVRWIEMYDGRPAHGQRVLLADEEGNVYFGHRGDAGCFFDDRGLLLETRPMRWWALEPKAPQTGEQR